VIQGRGAADRPLTLRDWSVAERALVDVGDTVVSERVGAYQERRGAGTLLADSRAQGMQASLGWVRAPRGDRLGFRLQTWIEGSDLANVSASVAANRDTASLADNQYATPAIGVGLNAALRQASTGHSWELGVDVRNFDGESREQLYSLGRPSAHRVAGGGQWIAGFYAEDSRTLGAFLLTGGVRVDRWNDYASKLIQTGSAPLNQRPADQGGVVPTGRIGLRRDLAYGLYLRAAAYAGFRPATLNELHRPFRVGADITLANPSLTPERLYGVEAGIGGSGLIAWDGDGFYNRLANAVTNVTIGKGPGAFPLAGFVPAGGTLFMRENAGVVNAYGAEGEAVARLRPALTLRAAFSYAQARIDGGAQAPQLTGLRPAQTPTTTITAAISWRAQDRLTLSGVMRYESLRYDDDLNTRRIDAGTGLNIRAELRFTRTFNGYIAAENVFDAKIQTGRTAANLVSYDAPRIVRLGIAFRQ
jgi:outer membrane cobalamin receptor